MGVAVGVAMDKPKVWGFSGRTGVRKVNSASLPQLVTRHWYCSGGGWRHLSVGLICMASRKRGAWHFTLPTMHGGHLTQGRGEESKGMLSCWKGGGAQKRGRSRGTGKSFQGYRKRVWHGRRIRWFGCPQVVWLPWQWPFPGHRWKLQPSARNENKVARSFDFRDVM